jgi:hypothetical protein
MRAVVVTIVLGLTAAPSFAQDRADLLAYEILARHLDAIGGREAVLALDTSYTEGILVLEDTGLSGEVEVWRRHPILERQNVDLGFLTTVTGDNGVVSWVVDANGKARLIRDTASLKRRELDLLRAELEHLDPDSEVFQSTLEGIELVGEASCYVVRTTNTINDDVQTDYINTTSYLVEKTTTATPDGEEVVRFSDYREVGGVMHAFRQEVESLPVGQRSRFEIVKLEVGVEIDPEVFEPPGRDAMDFRFLDGRSAEDVPFSLVDGHILIEVTVGGHESPWLLDSGAEASVVDTALARRLGLQPMAQVQASGVSDTVEVSLVTLPPFRVHSIEFEEQKIVASEVVGELAHRLLGLEVGGILGYDFLSRFVTRIDYARQRISFFRPEHFTYDGPGVVLDAPLKGRIPTLPVVVDDSLRGAWSLDLGDGAMSFHYPFAAAHGLLDRPGADHLSHGAGGSFVERMVRFKSVTVGGFSVPDLIIHVPLEAGAGSFSGGELAGNLGNGFLRHFVVSIDYLRQQVILEEGEWLRRRAPEDRSGLQIVLGEGPHPEVEFVTPGGPAARAGVQPGDRIVAINGLDVELLAGLGALRTALRAPAGTSYSLVLERRDQRLEVELTLADLV